jgi:hypothetical protein
MHAQYNPNLIFSFGCVDQLFGVKPIRYDIHDVLPPLSNA